MPFAAPAALVAFVALGTLAVLLLPAAADAVPLPGNDANARYAATCSAIIVLTALYVVAVATTRSELGRTWISWTVGYGAALALVKFILSPAAYQKSSASLAGFVTAGLVVLPLYLVALGVMYVVAARRKGTWPWASKVVLALVLAAVAVGTRLLVSTILGNGSEYLDDLLGVGLILPIAVAVASFAVMESFDRARSSLLPALRVGVALVLVQHLLWIVYMYRLFG